jgi:hypothetical protein
MTIDNDIQNPTPLPPGIQSSKEVALGNISGLVELDLSDGNVFRGTLIGNVTFRFTHAPTSPAAVFPQLILTQDATGGHTFEVEELQSWAGGEPAFAKEAHDTIFVSLYVGNSGSVILGFGGVEGKQGNKGEKGEKGATGEGGKNGAGSEEPLTYEPPKALGPNIKSFGAPYAPFQMALQANGKVAFTGLLELEVEKPGTELIFELPARMRPKYQKIMVVWDANNINNSFSLVVKPNGEVTAEALISPAKHVLTFDSSTFDINT